MYIRRGRAARPPRDGRGGSAARRAQILDIHLYIFVITQLRDLKRRAERPRRCARWRTKGEGPRSPRNRTEPRKRTRKIHTPPRSKIRVRVGGRVDAFFFFFSLSPPFRRGASRAPGRVARERSPRASHRAAVVAAFAAMFRAVRDAIAAFRRQGKVRARAVDPSAPFVRGASRPRFLRARATTDRLIPAPSPLARRSSR